MKIKANSPLLLSWAPALLIMGVLFYSSSLPGDRIHLPLFPFSDKLVHFLAYAVLGAAISLRFEFRRRLTGSPADLREPTVDFKGLASGILYGIGDEIHQVFVPMRIFGPGDMVADFLGVAAGYMAYRKVFRNTEPTGVG